MKCIIFAKTEGTQWIEPFFPGVCPYLLKIANKPLIEFYIDYCSINGINEIRIVTDNSSLDLRKYCSNGEKWGVTLSYSLAKEEDDDELVLLKNSKFCSGDEVFMISGFKFIHYSKNDTTEKEFEEIKTIKDIYDLNVSVLNAGSEKFVLPGYTKEKDVFIGQNVEISRSTDLKKPFSLGDNVKLCQLTVIGPDSIIGSNIIISSGSTIRKSVIYDGTYIGSDLDISEKIVFRNRIISPKTGAVAPIVDKFVVSSVEKNKRRSLFSVLFSFFLVLVLFKIMLAPFIILFFIGCMTKKVKIDNSFYYIDKELNNERFRKIGMVENSFISKLWKRLSLEKFTLLFSVVFGNLSLAGNRLMEDNFENSRIINELDRYRPALFNFSETLPLVAGADNMELHEHFYNNNNSMTSDFKMIMKSLIIRLID